MKLQMNTTAATEKRFGKSAAPAEVGTVLANRPHPSPLPRGEGEPQWPRKGSKGRRHAARGAWVGFGFKNALSLGFGRPSEIAPESPSGSCVSAPAQIAALLLKFPRSLGERAGVRANRGSSVRGVLLIVLALFSYGLAFLPPVHAQGTGADLIFTVGTTTRDAANRDWSFVMVGSADTASVRGKRFAVYGKPGDVSSAGSYTLRGNIFRQTDSGGVNTLLTQSVSLGQDLNRLAGAINTFLRRVPGISNQVLADKVLTLFRDAETNASSAATLSLLAAANPGLRLCLGQAFAEPMAGLTTYEVREINPASGLAAFVVGRVTIIPGSPIVLPAPGRPFQVVTNHPDDHLRVRLRWGTPDSLRRLSLLSYGFNVWRLPRAAAEGAGFHVAPPTLAQLRASVGLVLVNDTPVSTAKDFSAGNGAGAADDPADRETYFVPDNNGRRQAGGVEFVDGAEFYYFVTARDVLGRDGLVSPAGLGRACRRLPPLAPIELGARDEVQVLPLAGGGNTNVQRIRVQWTQRTNVTERVTTYWVYRWPNPGDALRTDLPATLNRIGVVAHAPGSISGSYLDNGPTAPVTPGLSNFWYTVRAVSVAACDDLASPHSPPVSAVLRVREGPAAGTGLVRGSCGVPAVRFENLSRDLDVDVPGDQWNYRLVCVRRDPGIAWVQFAVTNSVAGVSLLGPVYFPPGGDRVEIDYAPVNNFGAAVLDVGCVVGNYYGAVSRQALYHSESVPPARQLWRLNFLAGQLLGTALSNADPLLVALSGIAPDRCAPALDVTPDESGTVTMRFNHTTTLPVLVQAEGGAPNSGVWLDVAVAYPDVAGIYAVSYPACLVGPLPAFRGCIAAIPGEADCIQHVTSAAVDGAVAPLQIEFTTTPRTREYRLYRTVNDGALTLISQGAIRHNLFSPLRRVVRKDDTMPASAARLCYFVQLLDEHGNPSPMASLGCKEVKPPKPPTPTLAEPQAVGTPTSPQVALNWFCPTSGVHRFRVYIKVGAGAPGGGGSGFNSTLLRTDSVKILTGHYVGLRPTAIARSLRDVVNFGEAKLTQPLSAGFGPGPQFSLVANVYPDVPYQISVQALDAQGGEGDLSTSWEFTWKTPPPIELVPWPARPLPGVESFDARVKVVLFTNAENGRLEDRRYPVGLRIGQLPNLLDPISSVGTTNYAYYYRDATVSIDPNSHVFKRQTTNPERAGEPLLPIVVYRQQVTNALFPKVSGDVSQVSPMIERLPWSTINLVGQSFSVAIPDRLIATRFEFGDGLPNGAYYLYLRDQQPVVLGARYRYFVVRFKANREMDYIIPAGEVEVPLGSL